MGAGSLLCVTLLLLLCIRLLKGGVDHMMTFVWIGAIIVFGIVEAATAGLVSIWFVVGSVAALLAAAAGLGTLAQIVLFLVVSAAALAALSLIHILMAGGLRHLSIHPTHVGSCRGRSRRLRCRGLRIPRPAARGGAYSSVSYTHLDVYKRQHGQFIELSR